MASTLLSARGPLQINDKEQMCNDELLLFPLRLYFFLLVLLFCCCSTMTFWPTCEDVKVHGCVGSPDLCCDKWASEKPTDFTDESAQFQQLKEDDNSASEMTYGELEQRLGQLQDHLNRCIFLESTYAWHYFIKFSSEYCMWHKQICSLFVFFWSVNGNDSHVGVKKWR